MNKTIDYECVQHGVFYVEYDPLTGDPFCGATCPACGIPCKRPDLKKTLEKLRPIRWRFPTTGMRRPIRRPWWSYDKGRMFSSYRELDNWYREHDAYPMTDKDIENAVDQVQVAKHDALREEASVKKMAASGQIMSDDLPGDIEPD